MKTNKAFTFFFLAAVSSVATAQTRPQPAEQTMPAQSTAVDDVVVPVPSEVFATLDEFDDSNWNAVRRLELGRLKPHGDQTQVAVRLGIVIAEGFIAVKAKDADEVKDIGRAVLTLSRALGVEKWAIRRSRSIVDHAEEGNWAAVRTEWDAVLPDVQEGMKELKSDQVSQLVSLGGWLRGTEALTALIQQRYSAHGAELLRQSALIDRFQLQLNEMTNTATIVTLREGLTKMRAIVAASDEPIPLKSVKAVASVAKEALRKTAARRAKR